MIEHIIQIFEKHEFLTAISLITAFYLAPIFAKAFFAILGGIIAFIIKMLFNDALENKIRSVIGSLLGTLLDNEKVQVKDIPLLDSDYLCIFQLHIPVTEKLTIDIPTVRIRVRFWRLARKTLWLYLTHLDNKIAFNNYFKLLCSEELKEINLQNANILWECKEHSHAEECFRDASFDFSILKKLEAYLKLYEFHLLWERGDLKINLPSESISIENIGGHINKEQDKYEMYLHGLLNGQIMSITNLDTSLHRFRLTIPSISQTSIFWRIIAGYIPKLDMPPTMQENVVIRLVNIICFFKITDTLEVSRLEWALQENYREYLSK